jgi:hypothetical protein
MKTYSTELRDEIFRSHNFAVDLLEIHLGGGNNLYLATGGANISYDSPTAPDSGANVYQCQGEFMGFSGITEDFDVKVGKFTVYLSAIGTGFLDKFIGQSVEGSRVCVYKAFLSTATLEIVTAPILMFDGQIYNIAVSETAKSCQLNIDCSSLFADFERQAGRKTNNWSNWFFQGSQLDTSMEKTGFVGQSEFKWGRI